MSYNTLIDITIHSYSYTIYFIMYTRICQQIPVLVQYTKNILGYNRQWSNLKPRLIIFSQLLLFIINLQYFINTVNKTSQSRLSGSRYRFDYITVLIFNRRKWDIYAVRAKHFTPKIFHPRRIPPRLQPNVWPCFQNRYSLHKLKI
jgi:hypothetical protein